MTNLEDVVQGDVAEALPSGGQNVGGLLHLVLLVPGDLCVLGQGGLFLLTHFLKLLLGILEFSDISGKGRGGEGRPLSVMEQHLQNAASRTLSLMQLSPMCVWGAGRQAGRDTTTSGEKPGASLQPRDGRARLGDICPPEHTYAHSTHQPQAPPPQHSVAWPSPHIRRKPRKAKMLF